MNTSTAPLRFDPLLPVHKAIRQVLFEVAVRVGSVDASDIFSVDQCARQVGRLIALLPASRDVLVPLCDALYQRDSAARHAAAATLYGELIALVAAHLAEQQHAEATAGVELQCRHTDDELRAARRERLAAMSDGEVGDAVAALGPALTPQELADFLDDLQASVDAQAFRSLTDTLQRGLDAHRWSRVLRMRGVAEDLAPVCARPGTAAARDRRVCAPALHRRPHRSDRHKLLAQ